MRPEEPSEDLFCSTTYGELQSKGACGRYVSASHRALEKGLGEIEPSAAILEVGGNLGEHCRFVKHPYSTYLVTDYRKTDFVPPNSRISFEVADVELLPYDDRTFDRVLATCLLHHLGEPAKALQEVRRVTKPGGLVSLTLPCDPGMLYRFGKAVGPYRTLRRQHPKVDPRLFHYGQHRNHYPGLITLIDHYFANDNVTRRQWPLPVATWNFNLFTIFQIRIV